MADDVYRSDEECTDLRPPKMYCVAMERRCAVDACGTRDDETIKWIPVCENGHWMHQECLHKWFECKSMPTCPLCCDDMLGRIRDIVLWTEHRADLGQINRIHNEPEDDEGGGDDDEEGEEEEEEDSDDAALAKDVEELLLERDALLDLANSYGHLSMLYRIERPTDPEDLVAMGPPALTRLRRQLAATQQVLAAHQRYVRLLRERDQRELNAADEDEEEEETESVAEGAETIQLDAEAGILTLRLPPRVGAALDRMLGVERERRALRQRRRGNPPTAPAAAAAATAGMTLRSGRRTSQNP